MATTNFPTATTSPVDGAGDNNVTSLQQTRVYSGEVLSAFMKEVLAEKLFHTKVLKSGASMRFPIVNVGKKEDVLDHTAGTQISVNTAQADEVVIALDGVKYDSVLIDNKEAKVLDFDVTSPFTKKLGESLADKVDFTLFGHLRTAVETAGKGGQPDGSWIANTVIASGATAEEKGNAIVESIFQANANMSENNAPKQDRVFVTTEQNWYYISQATRVRNKDFQTKNGGIDTFAFDVIWIGNTMVIASNNLTLTDDFEGYLFHGEAIGLVKLISVITESEYKKDYFGNLITARYCYGSGILNPGLVVGIRSSAVALP